MSYSKRLWTLGIAMFVAAGIADRWVRYSRANSADLAAAVERVRALPLTLGPWTGELVESDDSIVKTSTVEAARVVEYRNNRTGHSATVALLGGTPGLVADWLPEQGFPFAGFVLDQRSVRMHDLADFAGSRAAGRLVSMDFRRSDSAAPLRVWQGWFDGEAWSRPTFPRVRFAAQSALYRLQVWSYLSPDPLRPKEFVDPGREFLADSLGAVTALLEGKAADAAESPPRGE